MDVDSVPEAPHVRAGGSASLCLLGREATLSLEPRDPALEPHGSDRSHARRSPKVATNSVADVAVVAECRVLHLTVALGPAQPLIARRPQRKRTGRGGTWVRQAPRGGGQQIAQQTIGVRRCQISLRLATVAGSPTDGAARRPPSRVLHPRRTELSLMVAIGVTP